MKINNPLSKNNLLILTPLILVMILDLIFTVVGQSAYYWQDYSYFNESSPVGQIFLMFNPLYFISTFILYLFFVIFLVNILPKPFNIMTTIGFFLGHVWGSSTWLGIIFYKLTGDNLTDNVSVWYLNIGYFVLIALISGFCISKWLKKMYEGKPLSPSSNYNQM